MRTKCPYRTAPQCVVTLLNVLGRARPNVNVERRQDGVVKGSDEVLDVVCVDGGPSGGRVAENRRRGARTAAAGEGVRDVLGLRDACLDRVEGDWVACKYVLACGGRGRVHCAGRVVVGLAAALVRERGGINEAGSRRRCRGLYLDKMSLSYLINATTTNLFKADHRIKRYTCQGS